MTSRAPAPPQSIQSLVKYNNPLLLTSKHPPTTPTEDILNSILPPREWSFEGALWVQYVSSTPATRSDLLALEERLNQRLIQQQARETGVDPVREELYSQCFDELIRQVTIHCAERGLLLLRVRDQLRLVVNSYQLLYESAIAFGMRKSLRTQLLKAEQTVRIKQLESEVKSLHQQHSEWQSKMAEFNKNEQLRIAEMEAKHQEEVDYLKKHNAGLKKELQNMLTIPQQPQGIHAQTVQ